MPKPYPFYLIKRPSKRGQVYYVVYDVDPGHPKSTSIIVDKSAKTKQYEPAGYDDAVAWAYANMSIRRDSSITLGRFAKDFFTEGCTWVQRMKKKGYTWHPLHLPLHR